MRRTMRAGFALAGVASVVVVLAATAGAARQPYAGSGISAWSTESSDRFSRLLGASNYSGFTPGVLRSNGTVRVVIQLAGKSVAEREADTAGELSDAERAAIRDQLRSRQEAIAERIRALGGTVVFTYQDAINGMSAQVPAKQVAAVAAIPGVQRVQPARIIRPDNVSSARYLKAPEVWNGVDGFTGDGVTVAVIDTGIDYTHANFGGPGTEEAYDAADAQDTTLETNEFNEKVIGGFDFVGDDYNADGEGDETIPQPDPDPLDCDGHGSHVAGTAAGYGVLADGTTYDGDYTSDTLDENDFRIGPGMAPEAMILAYRVFGCGGSATADVVVAAIDQAVQDGADVINMSLGSVFGRPDEADSIATNNAVDAGVVVVTSAGNSGPAAYITGSPGAADKAISTAAIDASRAELPGARIDLPGGGSIVAINANEAPLPGGPLEVKVLRNPDGTVALGCDPAEYVDVEGKLVVTLRGVCARVARAVHGEKAGAAAVVMINTSTAYPPFEGPIESNPDTGEEFLVTIPFLGVRGLLGPDPTDDGDMLVAADGQTVTLSPATVTNPGFLRLASFTSGGPRNTDSIQKPDVTAPGVSVFSTNSGTGNRGAYISGTSMASPAVAGVSALLVEAHPDWTPGAIKAALMNTAEAGPSAFAGGYDPRLAGAGAVQADRAVSTMAYTETAAGRNTLSYGYDQLTGPYAETHPLTLHNLSGAPVTYDLAATFTGNPRGVDFTFSENPVTVPAGGSTTVEVTVALTAAEVAALPPAVASNFGALAHAVRGVVVATPQAGGEGLYALRVPFMLVPRGLSNVEVTHGPSLFRRSIGVRNTGIHSGTADPFIHVVSDPEDVPFFEGSTDIRAVGYQVLPREALCGSDPVGVCGTEGDRALVFAINVWGFYSTPSVSEFDIAISTDADPDPEFFVVGVDLGAVLAGAFDGRFASFIFDAEGSLVNAWVAEAPLNGSTMLLPLLASDIGLSGRRLLNPLGSMTIQTFSFSIVPEDEGEENAPDVNLLDDVSPPAKIGLLALGTSTPLTASDPVTLAPGASATIPVPNAWLQIALGAKGWMIVTHDDANGAPQADLVPVSLFGR